MFVSDIFLVFIRYGTLKIFSVSKIQTLSEHKAAVTSVLCWDQKLLSCSLDKTVNVWAASESGNLQLMHTHSEEHVSSADLIYMDISISVIF